jgi:signal transduction histidine kinase
MGLSVVYGIVQSHGGAVTVKSKVGEGTTFSIVISREKAVEMAAAEEAASANGETPAADAPG